MLKSIIPAGKNASALLKDPTGKTYTIILVSLLFVMNCLHSGEVMCTIHSKVVEDHQKELHPGAVLVLRQVSVKSKLIVSHAAGNALLSHASSDIGSPLKSYFLLFITRFILTGFCVQPKSQKALF